MIGNLRLFCIFIFLRALYSLEESNYNFEKTSKILKVNNSKEPYFKKYSIKRNYPEETDNSETSNFYDIRPSLIFDDYQNEFDDINHQMFFEKPYYIESPLNLYKKIPVAYNGHFDNIHSNTLHKIIDDGNINDLNAKNYLNRENNEYNEGITKQHDFEGDNGYYKDEFVNKNADNMGKTYQEFSNKDNSGKKDRTTNTQKNYRKGHVTKGFKTSHRKDEEEKNETFYDESHEQDDHKNLNQNQGSFIERLKAGQEKQHINNALDSNTQYKDKHYNSENKFDTEEGDRNEYNEKKLKDRLNQFYNTNGLKKEALLGQQEFNKYHEREPYSVHSIYSEK